MTEPYAQTFNSKFIPSGSVFQRFLWVYTFHMGYEGDKAPEPAPRKRFSNLDEAMNNWYGFLERQKNDRVERDEEYADPEILSEDPDTLTVKVKGALRPITFSMGFETNDGHTAFLESKMDIGALLDHKGGVRRVMPHEEYEQWLAERKRLRKSTGDENGRDADRFEPKSETDYKLVMDLYGISWTQIDHAQRFAERYLLNNYRKRAGKPLLPKETRTYKYNFPSISPDKQAASKIIEETRQAPSPEKFWLDADKPEF